jgi:primosomal protein N' (replication factor Y)
LGIPVLMGSATPSLESWHNCERFEHYERLRLPDRVSRRTLPEVTIADMNEEYSETSGTPLLSRRLLAGLEGALSRGRQSILLINRRGFASWVQCPRCRHTVKCPSCNAAMVFHSAKGVVLCHYCGRREQAPEICPNPSCGGKLARMGGGTERVVERIEKLFPKARIARADSDILRKPEAYQALIEGFEARSFDVLVGTQMIAKGLDFPEVGFVGVVGADVAGGGTDFRTGERLFQLVTQVAGRAGRGERPGRVVLQTSTPESGAIQFGARHDFEAFAKQELASRFAARLPPYSRLTRCVFSDGSEQQALAAVREWVSRAEGVISELGVSGADVLGPAPCNRPRIRNRYRFEALLRYMRASEGHAILARVGANRRRRIALESVVIDVDPVDLF